MDLGYAMALSAGWKEERTMRQVTAIKQRAPTDNNIDCPWSVGVLNLTEAEADMVVQFASRVRTMGNDRARGNGYTATEMRQRIAERARGGDPDASLLPAYATQRDGPYRCSRGHLVPGGPANECSLCVREWQAEYGALKLDAEEIARRKAFLTGSWDPKSPGFDDTGMVPVNAPEKEPLTKPSEPGNRFSGLDLGSDSK